MEELEKEINEQDTYENQDVETIQAMQARFDAELAKEKQKYSALLKYATEGGKVSAEIPKEPTPAEQKEYLKEIAHKFRSNEIKGIDKIDALLKVNDIVTNYKEKDIAAINKLHGREIFAPTMGTPTERDIQDDERFKELLQCSMESSAGDTSIFQATLTSKLVDNINVKK